MNLDAFHIKNEVIADRVGDIRKYDRSGGMRADQTKLI